MNVKCLNHLEATPPRTLQPWSMEKLSSMKLDLDAEWLGTFELRIHINM